MHQCNLIKLNIQQPSLERGSKFILSLSPTLLLAQSKISKSLNNLESYPWEKLKVKYLWKKTLKLSINENNDEIKHYLPSASACVTPAMKCERVVKSLASG